MNQAMALLAKRSSSGRVSGVVGSSKNSRSADREAVGVERSAGDLGDAGGHGSRVGKKPRGDVDEENTRRVVARTDLDPEHFGPGKSLTITSSRKDVTSSAPPGSSAELPLRIEVHSDERWTVGANIPFQVFQAFDLPQDGSAYAERSRDEVADRCLARGGRFLADLAHIVRKYRADGKLVSEVAEARDGRTEAERKAKIAEKREVECAMELGKVRAELESARNAMKSIDKELERVKLQMVENRKEIEERKAEVARGKEVNQELEKAVGDLKLELEKSIEDVASGIGVGYQGCYDRLKGIGIDLTGHSFDDYCAGLMTDIVDGNSGKEPTDGGVGKDPGDCLKAGECPGRTS